MHTEVYMEPVLALGHDETENEILPVFFYAVASALGVSATFVAWVCSQCGGCTSFLKTLSVLRKWLFTSQGC